jgi:hypothetical protein
MPGKPQQITVKYRKLRHSKVVLFRDVSDCATLAYSTLAPTEIGNYGAIGWGFESLQAYWPTSILGSPSRTDSQTPHNIGSPLISCSVAAMSSLCFWLQPL